ncbi:MAG: cupin domain-containing protein [Kiloniellales bacterium]
MITAVKQADNAREEVFDEQSLGARLRKVRHELGLSLQEVASRSHLSIGMISQIERGHTSPTFRSLRLLSGALDMPIESFFNQPGAVEPSGNDVIVRPNDRRTLVLESKGIVTEYIDPDTKGTMQMMLMTIEPGGGTGRENDQHVGEEGGLILAGQFELWLDEERLILNEGDSFRFPASRRHRFRNPGSIPTRIVWFITPTLYGRAALERTL